MIDNRRLEQLKKDGIFNLLGAKRRPDIQIQTDKIKYQKEIRNNSDLNCKFKLKQNRINQRPNFGENKYNLDTLREKCRNTQKRIPRPMAPHNTSQFLINNHEVGRKENNRLTIPYMFLRNNTYDEFQDLSEKENTGLYPINDDLDIDEICLTGGTMKGMMNLTSLGLDCLGDDEKDDEEISTYYNTEKCEDTTISRKTSFEDLNTQTDIEIQDDCIKGKGEMINTLKDMITQNEIKIQELQNEYNRRFSS